MRLVLIHGRDPFSPPVPLVIETLNALRAGGHEVDYVWLPRGVTKAEQRDGIIAAKLLYLEGVDKVITIGFPADYVASNNVVSIPENLPFEQISPLLSKSGLLP
jgi:hypothetical protein